MKTNWALAAGALLLLISVSADARRRQGEGQPSEPLIAPWKDIQAPQFRELVALYAKSALEEARIPTEREKVAEAILMSDATTYDEYTAAKESGVGAAELRATALAAMERETPTLTGKKFMVLGSLDYYAYEQNAQGFPVYDRWDQAESFVYANPHMKYAEGSSDPGYLGIKPPLGYAAGFRFPNARIALSKLGWVIPATPEQAREKVQELGRTGESRTIAAIIVFTINKCRPRRDTNLNCSGQVEAVYGYRNKEAALRTRLPLFELVERDVPEGWITLRGK